MRRAGTGVALFAALLLVALALGNAHEHHHHAGCKHDRERDNAIADALHEHLASGGPVPRLMATIKKALVTGTVRAGVAKLDVTLPIGTPLAGFNWGSRRVKHWPLPEIRAYTTFMMPSVGVLEPTWARALVIDVAGERVAFVTIDAIGADGNLVNLAYDLAVDNGFTVPRDNFIMSASHSHSGPGAVSPELLWSLAPATDLLVPELQTMLASGVAKAMVQAEQSLAPVALGIGVDTLIGVTRNRRAGISPYVTRDTIDPHLGIIRVDDLSGRPIATLWNFAMHGTCYGPENMQFSGDIMGRVNMNVESTVGGVALFVNADAGDIDPTGEMCQNAPDLAGGPIIGAAIAAARAKITTSTTVGLSAGSVVVPFGPTNLNATLERFSNCTRGGPLDVCTICEVLKCDVNAHLPGNWVENTPRFTAMRFDINGQKNVLVSMPGEPLVELGWWVRNDTAAMGFDNTLLAGYTNSHMGYFATPNEYDIGGYESQLTFWGINTALMVRSGAYNAAQLVAP